MNLAKRLQLIKPSPTLMVTAQVAALRRQGIEVIDFGAGEPDFDTPEHTKAAAVTALRQGKTKYTSVGGQPKLLLTSEETGFKITAAQLRAAIGPQSKALLLNSPSNPTGAAYSEEELRQIAEVIEQSTLLVISDDVYEKFLYDSPRCAHLLALKPHLRDRVLIVNSVSKTYAMTGWRLGYAAGPREVIAAIETLQSQSTSNPNSITQAAAVVALTGTQEPVGI